MLFKMSAVSPNQRTGFWGKVKTSTKSLSSSLSHLTEKTETDGDTEDSTVVHKALVKFYESQDPFLGFPAWLGEKENLPDEQKILENKLNKPQNLLLLLVLLLPRATMNHQVEVRYPNFLPDSWV